MKGMIGWDVFRGDGMRWNGMGWDEKDVIVYGGLGFDEMRLAEMG